MTKNLLHRKYHILKVGLNSRIKEYAKEKRNIERRKGYNERPNDFVKVLVLDRVINQLRFERDFAESLK